MIRVTTIQVRPSIDVPFFGAAHPEAVAAVMMYLATVPGYLSTESSMSVDHLTQTTFVDFVDQAALDTHRASFQAGLTASWNDARRAYNTANGIVLTSSVA
jgi:hypothetical protein